MTGGEGVVERLGTPLARGQADADLAPRVQVFPGEERQLGVMRQWLAGLLSGHSALDDVLSIATELATNAIRHTRSGRPGGSFAVVVIRHLDGVRVAVADRGGRREPRVIDDPDPDREEGRGLLIVRALATRAGVRGDHWGRLVWADVGCATAGDAEADFGGYELPLGQADTVELPLAGKGELALRQLRDDGFI